MLAALLFFGAMFWAKGRDPFQRIWFDVRPGGYPKTECVAVLPKTAPRPLPVVIYLHGSGGSLLGSGNELRQMAEMGLAAVGMEYDQTNAAVSAAQWATLLRWIRRQSWADSNRVAWVGFSLGAQRQLAFALEHPEAQPNLLVRLSGGSSPELEDLETARAATPRFSSLLIHGERDEVFPLAEARRVAGWLRTNGVPVQLKVVP
ncbi:MAG TPA: dienelactone hydrolase family protein, partial [Terracidiphilus sp.]|nr:dienelactone hydrolase family protein [Terracidiphilus sp.]